MPRKTIIITGSTSGIGEQTAVELARKGDDMYLLVRNMAKGEKMKRHILVHSRNPNVYLIECDLSSLASVKKATDQIKAITDKIDILVNNAGSVFPKLEITKEGLEKTFAVNHLGHFLLTLNLMPLLQKGKARVVNISSAAHKGANPNMDKVDGSGTYSSIKAYANAKLYNIYFTQLLAQKYGDKGVTAYAVHPGLVNTKFGANYKGLMQLVMMAMRSFMVPALQGAVTPVYVATQPGLEAESGKYFFNKKVTKPAPIANNETLRNELWAKSLQLVKPFLNPGTIA